MSHMSVGVPEGTVIEAIAECTCLWVVVPKQKNGIWCTLYKLEKKCCFCKELERVWHIESGGDAGGNDER